MANVTFDHIHKTYPGGTDALVDCTLEVADGELMVVVGPSGCGKSTLLRLVAGLEMPTGGTLRIGDRVANDLRPQERNVAMVFQDYALYPYLTARGNLEFPLRMRKLPRDEQQRRIERVAALLDIGALLDRLPKQLSGGQRQRVAMGRALVREPAVFLLDEPLSNLDATLRGQVRAEIKDLQGRTGTTMIYVTHDQVEAMTLGDRVTVLHEGRLQQVATPRDLYEHPENAFVAAFIGNPPMNLLPARMAIDVAGQPVIEIAGQQLHVDLPASSWRDHDGTAVRLGIRPEALRIKRTAGATAATELSATVARTESLGHETLVYGTLSAPGAEPVAVIARAPGMPDLRVGEAVILEMDATRLQLFATDGRRIGPPYGEKSPPSQRSRQRAL